MSAARSTRAWRAKRKPLTRPDHRVSLLPAGTGVRGSSACQAAGSMGRKKSEATSTASPSPIRVAISPAMAGPTERAALKAIEPSATALGSSGRGTRPLMEACWAGW